MNSESQQKHEEFNPICTPNVKKTKFPLEIVSNIKVATNAVVSSRPIGCFTRFFSEFVAFAKEGDILDLAVAVVIGTAIKQLVTSLVNYILTPPIGLATGSFNLENVFFVLRAGDNSTVEGCNDMSTMADYKTVATARECGAVIIAFGGFVQSVIDFIITAFAIFVMIKIVRGEIDKDLTKSCETCCSEIPLDASVCCACKCRVLSCSTRKCPYCCTVVDNRTTICSGCRNDLKPISIAEQNPEDSLFEKSISVRNVEFAKIK